MLYYYHPLTRKAIQPLNIYNNSQPQYLQDTTTGIISKKEREYLLYEGGGKFSRIVYSVSRFEDYFSVLGLFRQLIIEDTSKLDSSDFKAPMIIASFSEQGSFGYYGGQEGSYLSKTFCKIKDFDNVFMIVRPFSLIMSQSSQMTCYFCISHYVPYDIYRYLIVPHSFIIDSPLDIDIMREKILYSAYLGNLNANTTAAVAAAKTFRSITDISEITAENFAKIVVDNGHTEFTYTRGR